MIFPDKYKVNKKYPKKLFLDNKEIESKDRTFIKKHIVSVELVAQISGEDIPSVDNEDYKYKVIQYLEVELDDIKNAKDMGSIFQNIFKSPLIVKFYDKSGYYAHSYALKRISKVDNKDVVLIDYFTTKKVDSFIDIETRELYNKFLAIDKVLNNSNKVCLYYEIYTKAFIIENRKLINNFINLLESKVYYNFENIISIYNKLVELIQCENSLKKANTINLKIEINYRKKLCEEIIKKITTIEN